jgi:hypothetical protein
MLTLMGLYCNPAKHAVNQKAIIDEAIAKWVLENPIPMSEIIVPGDTTFVRDTSWLPYLVWDTLVEMDTVRLVKIRYRTVREIVKTTDTVIRTVNNTAAIVRLSEEKNLLQGRLFGVEKTQERQRWWIISLIVLCVVLILTHIKRR